MKQTISPAIAIGAIVVVIAVVAIIGFKTLGKHSSPKLSGQDYQSKMSELQRNQEGAMKSGRGGMPGGSGMGSGGSGAGGFGGGSGSGGGSGPYGR